MTIFHVDMTLCQISMQKIQKNYTGTEVVYFNSVKLNKKGVKNDFN